MEIYTARLVENSSVKKPPPRRGGFYTEVSSQENSVIALVPPSARTIIRRIAAENDVEPTRLVTATHSKKLAAPRQQAMAEIYSVRRDGRRVFSLARVAKMFGCTDHTTVRHAIKRNEAAQ